MLEEDVVFRYFLLLLFMYGEINPICPKNVRCVVYLSSLATPSGSLHVGLEMFDGGAK